jgi:hypothetical protein
MSERQKWTPREEDLLIALDVVGASTDEISTQIYDYIFNLKEEDGNEKGDARKCRRDTKNAGTQ